MILSVVWCATFSDRVRHARVAGWRICRPRVRVGSPEYWRDGLAGKEQPGRACPKCRNMLNGAMRALAAGRQALGDDAE